MDERNGLKGKVAIVTGAGRGIGRCTAIALAERGAVTVLAARTAGELQRTQREIMASGGTAKCIKCDMAKEGDIKRLIGSVISAYGRLDILINNAGAGVYGPLERFTTKDFDRLMAVNARGPFIACREALPHLRKAGSARIVNIASVMAVKGYKDQSAYAASKHALLGMSKSLAKEVQNDGIRVHVICPGGVDTDMVGKARPDIKNSELIRPEEIADLVVFLVTRSGRGVIDQLDIRRETSTAFA